MRTNIRPLLPHRLLVISAILLCTSGILAARKLAMVAPPPAGGKTTAGVHITDGSPNNNGDFRKVDGGGSQWYVQTNGAVQGNNNVYGSAMYLNINNNGFYAQNYGIINAAGDELELGPWSPDGRLRVSRRIKIYSDKPLARWLDIYENSTDTPMTVQTWTYVNCNWNIGNMKSSSGQANFGENDYALATQVTNVNPAPPALAHIFCSKTSKLRPQVTVQPNQIDFRYNITIPANGTVILCHFESQNNSFEDQVKLISSFQASKALRDLPVQVRRLIANFNTSNGLDDLDIERWDKFDSATLSADDALHGKILNQSFEVDAFYGKQTIPASRVVGMAANPAEPESARFLLTDGQIIAGKISGQKLQMQLLAGPTLAVPLERLAQWSFAISPERPYELPAATNMVTLRTGERLAFDPKELKLTLQSLYGPVPLEPEVMQRVGMDNPSNAVHQATFLNGSTIAGMLLPDKIDFTLKLGSHREISRNMISEIIFNPASDSIAPLAKVRMANGDELVGQLTQGKLTVKTDYGQTDVEPRSLRSLTFSEGHVRAILELWDGTKGLHGDLESQELCFQVTPGPMVRLPVPQVIEFWSPYALPPETALKEAVELIKKLNSDSWKERQEATAKLIKIGPCVVPLLEDKLDDRDAEVRQRAATIIEAVKSGIKPPPSKASGSPSASVDLTSWVQD